MLALAHRGNRAGQEPARENTLAWVSAALAAGYGLETDIRCSADGIFYISHDRAPLSPENLAAAHCRVWRQSPGQIVALNIKERGHEAGLLEFLDHEEVLPQIFLFDMELIEDQPGAMAERFHALNPSVRLAARISDRDEPLTRALNITSASVIWLDEFDRLWARQEDILRLQAAGKQVYAVSPEIHGFDLATAQRRWDEFVRWGVAGVCTDWPDALAQRLGLLKAKKHPDGKASHL